MVMENKSPAALVRARVNDVVETHWDQAKGMVDGHRRRSPHATPDELAKKVVSAFVRDVTVGGVMAGGGAAVPGGHALLKAGKVGGVMYKSRSVFRQAAIMVMAVAEAYDYDLHDLEVRRDTVASVLSVFAGASGSASAISGAVGAGLGERATKSVPMSAVHAVNGAVKRPILRKWADSGSIRLGLVLPVAVGATIGGTSNYLLAKAMGLAAIKEFRPTGDLTGIDVIDVEVADGDGDEATP